jgi:hypothetical protein
MVCGPQVPNGGLGFGGEWSTGEFFQSSPLVILRLSAGLFLGGDRADRGIDKFDGDVVPDVIDL